MNCTEEKKGTPRRPGWAGAVGIGAVIGGLVGVVEVLVLWQRPGTPMTREYLLVGGLLYAVAGAAVGLILLGLTGILLRRPPSRALRGAVILAFFGFVVVAGYVNTFYLPHALDRLSLLITGMTVAGFVALGFGLHRLFGFLGRAGARVRLVQSPWFGWGVGLALAVAVGVVSFYPAVEGDRLTVEGEGGRDINVLFIVIDSLRPDHVSAYGYERETSPNIDRWAEGGVVFENAMAQAPWTKPSTASMLTSLYPSTHGVNLMASGLPQTVRPLPEIMKENGYRTAVFTADCFVSPMFGYQRGVDCFHARGRARFTQVMLGHLVFRSRRISRLGLGMVDLMGSLERWLLGATAAAEGFRVEDLYGAFTGWLDEIGGRRFFAYFHCMEPHEPYAPPSPFDEKFLGRELQQVGRVEHYPIYRGFLPFGRGRRVSADSLENMVALYDGEISYADSWIGELLGDLERRGIFENTLIVLTADHGEEFYDHGGWGHGQSLFQELLHVPLIMSGPRILPGGGQRIPHVVRHIDILPTILEVCGIPVPEAVDGSSLLPILQGEEPPLPSRAVMSEVYYGGHCARALRDGPEKVIYAEKGGDERLLLFDLEWDPGEAENLTEREGGRARALLTRLEEFHRAAAERAAAGYTVTIDEETRERLKALGYVQ